MQTEIKIGVGQLLHDIARKYKIPFSKLDEMAVKRLNLKNMKRIGKAMKNGKIVEP